jgi:hypothetical protein
MRNLVALVTLFAVVGVASSFCEPPKKSAFSISIRSFDSEVPTGQRVEFQITKTNLTNQSLPIGGNRIASYAFEVRRNGVLVPETEQSKNLREHPVPGPMIDGNLPPHRYALDTVAVNEYRDMRQSGVYTVQVREGNVRSNTVNVTVTP